jgi:quercetin dioxygenase-like cupin family protein
MEVIHLQHAEKLPLVIDAWRLLSEEKVELIELHLKQGEEVEKHFNPSDVFFYILSGQGELRVDELIYFLKRSNGIQVKKESQRQWKNTHKEDLKMLVFKY